jgi:hypothetical protein
MSPVQTHAVGIAIDLESDGRLRSSRHDQHVDARALERIRVRSAAGRIADAADQRALAYDHEAAALRRDRPVEQAGSEDQRIGGPRRDRFLAPFTGANVQGPTMSVPRRECCPRLRHSGPAPDPFAEKLIDIFSEMAQDRLSKQALPMAEKAAV